MTQIGPHGPDAHMMRLSHGTVTQSGAICVHAPPEPNPCALDAYRASKARVSFQTPTDDVCSDLGRRLNAPLPTL